nr:ASCH domain-containing protein [Nocardioides perillae]
MVLEGRKRATAGLVAEYAREGEPVEHVGERLALLDSDGHHVGTVRVERVDVVRFDEVPDDFALAEGEGDRSGDDFRASHRAFWEGDGEVVADDTGVVLVRFALEPDLVGERRRVLERLAQLRGQHAEFVDASRDTNADDEHDPEGATIAFERSQVETLVRQAERRLAEVDEALARLEDGSYGTCAVCGRPIAPERLAARPAATRCVACA